jgi:hypothetical protein
VIMISENSQFYYVLQIGGLLDYLRRVTQLEVPDCRLDSSQYPSETPYLRLGIEAAHCTFVRGVGLIIYSLLPAPIASKTAHFLADQALGRY